MKHKSFSLLSKILMLCTFSLLLATAGCQYLPFGYTSIEDILNDPSAYDNREVKVKGTVTEVTKIPLVEMKMYVLSDGERQIVVVTNDKTPPTRSKVAVVGRVENIAILGNESIGLHIRELKRVDNPLF